MVWKDFFFPMARGFQCCWVSLLPQTRVAAFTAANLAGKTSNSMVRRWAECFGFCVCVVWSWLFNGRFKSTSTVYGKTHGLVIWPWWWSWKTVHCMSLLPFMDGLESGFLVNTSVFSIQIYYETILLHVNSSRLHFNDRSCMSCFFSKVSSLLPQLICPFHGSSSFRAVWKACFALKIHLTVGAFYQPLIYQPIL